MDFDYSSWREELGCFRKKESFIYFELGYAEILLEVELSELPASLSLHEGRAVSLLLVGSSINQDPQASGIFDNNQS